MYPNVLLCALWVLENEQKIITLLKKQPALHQNSSPLLERWLIWRVQFHVGHSQNCTFLFAHLQVWFKCTQFAGKTLHF